MRAGNMMLSTVRLHLASLVGLPLVLAGAGCATDQPAQAPVAVRALSSVGTLGNSAGGCSTSVVLGLATQIAEQAACDNPNSFVSFASDPGLTITSNAVLPYLLADARVDLDTAAKTTTLQINSALRTLAQQYLLYQWWQEGACGITDAATVGNSNHEGGRAVDLANYDEVISLMARDGWAYDVPGDVVHFDHTASADDRGRDVLAFQELWNANNPSDQIGEDGDYGPQTEARLVASPATGFAKGPTCSSPPTKNHAVTVSVDGPDHVTSGQTAHYAFTVQNQSQTDWSDATAILVASGQASQLYDAASWTSPTQVGTVPATIAAGTMATIEFDVQAPTVTADMPIGEPLNLVDGGAVVGTINFGVTVTAQPDNTSSDDNNEPNPSPPVTGGCNAGGRVGGGATFAMMMAAIALVARRRPRAR